MSHLIAILLQMYVFSAKPPKIERNFSDWVGKKTASFFGSIQIKVHFCTVDEKKSKGEGGSRGQVHVAHFSYTQDVFCIDFVIFRKDWCTCPYDPYCFSCCYKTKWQKK